MNTMLGTPPRAACAATEFARLPVEATSRGPKPRKQAGRRGSGNRAAQPGQARARGGEPAKGDCTRVASTVDVMTEAFLSSFPALAGAELAPAARGLDIEIHRSGCRGFNGPFPLPLWMRYSVVAPSLPDLRTST